MDDLDDYCVGSTVKYILESRTQTIKIISNPFLTVDIIRTTRWCGTSPASYQQAVFVPPYAPQGILSSSARWFLIGAKLPTERVRSRNDAKGRWEAIFRVRVGEWETAADDDFGAPVPRAGGRSLRQSPKRRILRQERSDGRDRPRRRPGLRRRDEASDQGRRAVREDRRRLLQNLRLRIRHCFFLRRSVFFFFKSLQSRKVVCFFWYCFHSLIFFVFFFLEICLVVFGCAVELIVFTSWMGK